MFLSGHTSNFVSSLFLDRDAAVFLLGIDKWKEILRNSVWGTPTMNDLIVVMPGKLRLNTHHCCQYKW